MVRILAALVLVLVLSACGNSTTHSKAVNYNEGNYAGAMVEFEARVSKIFIQEQKAQNYVDATVESMDCLKNGDVQARCIAVIHDYDGTMRRFSIEVYCDISNVDKCQLFAEPIN